MKTVIQWSLTFFLSAKYDFGLYCILNTEYLDLQTGVIKSIALFNIAGCKTFFKPIHPLC